MKNSARWTLYFLALFSLVLSRLTDVNAQIVISSDNFPTSVGTFIITENNINDSIEVYVGLPGENQIWDFDQNFPSVLYRQLIVDASETGYANYFPEANVAIRYEGNLGNLIHSYYFNDTKGIFHLFQEKTADRILMHGIGIDTATVTFQEFRFNYSGQVKIEPNILLNNFPLQFNHAWESVSQFALGIDTLLSEGPLTLLAHVQDSMYNVVDGWGTIILPSSRFDCLRIKSYITLIEKIFLNGVEFRSQKTRTINYSWVAKDYGIVAKITSHSNQPEDNFKFAKQVYRLHLFNPHIKITAADTSGVPDEVVDIPIYISDVTDLNIRKIKMSVDYDAKLIEPMEILTLNTITENWQKINYGFINNKFTVELSGETPLNDDGVLYYLRVSVLPTAATDTTVIRFRDLVVDQPGPQFDLPAGIFIVNVATELSDWDSENSNRSHGFKLYSNYPNPFNSATTITFQLEKASDVSIEIYNLDGQLITTLMNRYQERGFYRIQWNGTDSKNEQLPSGAYFCRLKAIATNDPPNSFNISQKMMLLR